MARLLALAAVTAAAVLAAPTSAWACASDQSSYLETFPDATCLLLGAGAEIDADGGLRLKTGGTATPTTWDTDAQFTEPGSLRVVGTGEDATLELQPSELPLTRVAPATIPSDAELAAGATQVRDSEGVEDPSVIKVGTTYVMYYTGYAEDGAPPAIYRVESTDGQTFPRPAANSDGVSPNPAPVLAPTLGTWDANGVSGADVIYDPADATAPYRLYYSGVSAGVRAIGYATSTDGVAWVKQAEPVLRPGLPGSRDAFAVANPSVMKDGELFKMWYEGDDSTVKAIGYATSVDGVAWKRAGLPEALQQDPEQDGDPKIAFGIGSPTVWKDGTTYRMLFVGRNAGDPTSTRIITATSPDGVEWALGNPEENPHAGRFYATNFFSPDVMADGATFRLYFAGDRSQGTPADDRSRIGLATGSGASFNFVPGSGAYASVYGPPADGALDSARFDARAVRGLSVADPGGTHDWVGVYAGTRSTRAGGSGESAPKLGVATYDPQASTPAWTKRDGTQADKSILPLGAEDADGQSDPSLVYSPTGGATDDWFVYYTARAGTARSLRVASADESSTQNELRPGPWTKLGEMTAAASHPSALREGAASPIRIYHTVEDGTPNSMALVTSTGSDDPDGPFGAPAAVTFTGPATCDPDGGRDPVVIQVGTTLHMLYTGLEGSARNACYATADASASYTAFARKGLVMPPSEVAFAYDERRIVPAAMFFDAETPAPPLVVHFTGTDRGERRFVDALGATATFDQRTRIGRATSPLPIAPGLLPSGTATGQIGAAAGPLVDFRRISREKTGSKVELSMSVLQPYSTPSQEYWSEWFPVVSSTDDVAAQDLTFRFGVRAARWRARLSEPAGTPKVDSVTVESGPLQFEPAGTATTTEIGPPETFQLGAWSELVLRSQTYTFPGATASAVSGTVTVLGAADQPVVPATQLALGGFDQTISLASVPATAHPELKVKLDLAGEGATPQSTPLVKQLRVTYTSAKTGTNSDSDGDGDGVLDTADACPAAAGPAATAGCPDADGDGVRDSQDACPAVAAPGQANGCLPDGDSDGVADALDACPTVAASGSLNGCPTGLTLAASRPRVVYGRTAILSGTLMRGPAPVPGQMVTVLAQPVGAVAAALGTAVTDIAGRWALTVKPRRHTTYTATLAGVAAPAPVVVQVAHRLRLSVTLSARRATISGVLSPSHARRTVTIRRRVGSGSFRRFVTLRTTRRSTFRVSKSLRKGRYRFRAITGRDRRHLAGRSPVRRVTVR